MMERTEERYTNQTMKFSAPPAQSPNAGNSWPDAEYSRYTLLLLLVFWPLTALILFLDSRAVAAAHAPGQLLANLLTPVFLLLLLGRMKPQQRLMAVLFVPLSALGEGIFSLLFGLYEYRLQSIPLYVPFGHSILMSVGLLLAQSRFVQRNLRRVQAGLLLLHGALILAMLLCFGDTLSTLWAILFLLLLRKQSTQPFYLILGVLVLYIELLGTAWGCWTWRPDPFGVLSTTNPPVGAFTCYVIGDLLAMRIAMRVQSAWNRARARWPVISAISATAET